MTKKLLIVCVGFILILVLVNRGPTWLAAYLMKDFDSLTQPQQQNRLIQMASLGTAGINPLVTQLPSEDPSRAELAQTLLSDLQNSWITLDPKQRQRNHQQLVRSIDSVADQLSDYQTSFAVRMTQTSRDMGRQLEGESGDYLVRQCDDLMDRLTLSSRNGPSVLDDDHLDPNVPSQVVIRPRAIAIASEVSHLAEPTPHSTPHSTPRASGVILKSGSSGLHPISPERIPDLNNIHDSARSHSTSDLPQIIQTSGTPESIVAGKPIMRAAAAQAITPPSMMRATLPISNSPVEAFVDESIYPVLHSEEPSLREAAEIELRSRGYTNQDLHLAAMAGSPRVEDRIALVDHLATLDQADPRPWLRRLLSDNHRDVRLRTISVIATMNDPDAEHILRLRLAPEQDPVVAARLRRVLKLR